MKGMILAAGEGQRLRPWTNDLPKPMLPVAGRPLLEYIIVHLSDCGFTEFAINLHHLPHKVTDYFGNGSSWQVTIHYSIEPKLLGSAGGVKRLQFFFDETFIVYYGDVLTWADLRSMVAFHRQAGVSVTMGLYQVLDPWNRGIAQLDAAQMIVRFVEKPARDQIFSNLANAGIYILEPEVLDWIPPGQLWDFGRNVFPDLLNNGVQMAGFIINDPLIDIGLPEKYEEANRFAAAYLANSTGEKTWHQ